MYAAESVSVTFGSLIITGFVKGSFVVAKRNEPIISTPIGSDGKGVDVKNANESGTFEFTLQQSSSSVADLNAAALALTRDSCVVRDLLGTELAQGVGRVTGLADAGFSNELGERKFVITCQHMVISGGGGHAP